MSSEARDAKQQAGRDALAALARAEGRPVPRRSRPRVAADEQPLRVERLGSVAVSAALHAAYPTAKFTLCGLRFAGRPNSRGALPDCTECVSTAAAFDGVDRCAPAAWRRAWSK